MSENDSKFKQDFTYFLKDFVITPIWTSIMNPQYNTLLKSIHKVIYNIIVTKDIDRKLYDYI